MKNILIIAFLLAFGYSNAQQTGSLKDSRDGKTYKTVKIGNQWWMAENLAYNSSDSYTFDEKLYGRVYTFEKAKNVCPSGWHLPSKSEWETVLNTRLQYGSEFPVQLLSGNEKLYYRGKDIKRRKENMKKSYRRNLYNKTGLALVPSSFYNISKRKFQPSYEMRGIGIGGLYWTNTKSKSHYEKGAVYRVAFSYDSNKMPVKAKDPDNFAYAVRCVKD